MSKQETPLRRVFLITQVLMGVAIAAPPSLEEQVRTEGFFAQSSISAPESLTVRFYGKVYAQPSADSPLLGMAEDGIRVPVYRHKGAWVQIGFNAKSGWMLQSHPQGGPNTAAPSAATAVSPAATSRKNILLPLLLVAGAFLAWVAALWKLLSMVRTRKARRKLEKSNRVSIPAKGKPSPDIGKPCSLEGRFTRHGLVEILQFLEIGRKTGLLSVESGQPTGVINFESGHITFAQTVKSEGDEAVFEILSMDGGSFRFFSDKRVRQTNCRLAATQILLQWAKRMDDRGEMIEA